MESLQSISTNVVALAVSHYILSLFFQYLTAEVYVVWFKSYKQIGPGLIVQGFKTTSVTNIDQNMRNSNTGWMMMIMMELHYDTSP